MQSDNTSNEMQNHPSPEVMQALSEALENLTVGVCLLDNQGSVVFTNDALAHYLPCQSVKEFIGKKLDTWLVQHSQVCEALTVALEKGASWAGDVSVMFEGESHCISVSIIPNRLEHPGEVKFVLVLFRNSDDIQRARLVEAQMERNRIMVESIGTICHAIGQPATVLLSSIEMMRMGIFDDKAQKETLDMCYDAVLEVRDLLRKLSEKRRYFTEAYLSNDEQGASIVSLDSK